MHVFQDDSKFLGLLVQENTLREEVEELTQSWVKTLVRLCLYVLLLIRNMPLRFGLLKFCLILVSLR